MKESNFYHKALDIALLNGQEVKAALDTRIGRMPRESRERSIFPWQRVAMTAVGTLLLIFTVLIAIPSARAEVLSWLGIITRPQDYLTADPSERPAIEVLDNMIATAQPEDTELKVLPIDRTDSKAVNSEGALKVAELLNQDVRITLGDTLFDGNTAYVSLHLGGTAALPLLEDHTGGNRTKVQVDPQRVWFFFEGGPGEEYMSGEKKLYMSPSDELILEFGDGTTVSQFPNLVETEAYKALWAQIESKNFHWDQYGPLPEEREEINRLNRAFLEKNEVVAAAEFASLRPIFERNADESGVVKAKAFFKVFVEEDDDLPATELLHVEVGTVRFNVNGYQAMETRAVDADGKKVLWKGDTVVTYMELVDPADHDRAATDWNTALQMFTNYPVSLDGMTLEALPGAKANAVGIYDLDVRIMLPDSIQGNARAAWTGFPGAFPIDFNILIDGQAGQWYPGGFGMTENGDGTFTYHIVEVRGLDLETIDQIRTVTLVPVLRYVKGFQDPAGAPILELPLETRTPQPQTADGTWLGPRFERIEYPEYALSFTLG